MLILFTVTLCANPANNLTRSPYHMYGHDVISHHRYHTRRAIFARICDVYIMFGGGPGTINEVMHALAQGAIVIPFCRTGGAASGKFGFPHCPLPSTSSAVDQQTVEAAFRELKDADHATDRDSQMEAIKKLIEFGFASVSRLSDARAMDALALPLVSGEQRDVQDVAILILSLLRRDASGLTNVVQLSRQDWHDDGWLGWENAGRPSRVAVDLIERMLDGISISSMAECLEHPWFVHAALPPPIIASAGRDDSFAYEAVEVYRQKPFAEMVRAVCSIRARTRAPPSRRACNICIHHLTRLRLPRGAALAPQRTPCTHLRNAQLRLLHLCLSRSGPLCHSFLRRRSRQLSARQTITRRKINRSQNSAPTAFSTSGAYSTRWTRRDFSEEGRLAKCGRRRASLVRSSTTLRTSTTASGRS